MRIGFLSDLHIVNNVATYSEALDVVIEAYHNAKLDKLFIAGDTSNRWKTTLDFIDDLVSNGLDVYTIFGNHEYWSISYNEMQEKEFERYINGKAVELDNDWVVVSIDGMFDYSFVTEVDNYSNGRLPKDIEMLNNLGKSSFDLSRNKVGDYEEVANMMQERLVETLEENKDKNIILMTHYVPSSEFIIYMDDDDRWNANNAFMGSQSYQRLAEEYGVKKVIFGHTHIKYNKTINGIDYYCNPVGYKDLEFASPFRKRVNDRLRVFEIWYKELNKEVLNGKRILSKS